MAKKVSKNQLKSGIHAIFPKMDEEIKSNPQKVVKELANTVATIPIKEIEVNPNQPRKEFDPVALEELASSIKTYGLIQPITVRRLSPKEYQIISGERRWRASKIAGLKEVPAYIRIANDEEMLGMAIVENIQRENLNAMEIAFSYLRLKQECSLTDEELSERMGKKRTTITNYLRLVHLPPMIQEGVKSKKISFGHARELAGVDSVTEQMHLYKKVVDEELSVRALENLRSANKKVSKTPKVPASVLSPEYKAVEQEFKNFFGSGSISIKVKSNGSGQIILPFGSVEELNNLLDRIEE